MQMTTTHLTLAWALRGIGLDDDAARLMARASGAHTELRDAESAVSCLRWAAEELRRLHSELESVASTIQAALAPRWRSEAAREYAERTDGLHRTARDCADEALQWLLLCSQATEEAETAVGEARRRLEIAEAAAHAALMAGVPA
ncbi:hypothetical protein [Micrococcus sp.]|uniref:hypothetical protein n=1 Tax=Micrococcus sp. TaxID=1271 RepID=UPI002A909A68|nr:hypothetical protein [Micrococcus sp.]MDY6054928.1 hypothetical protein [Micrococcus sp.]